MWCVFKLPNRSKCHLSIQSIIIIWIYIHTYICMYICFALERWALFAIQCYYDFYFHFRIKDTLFFFQSFYLTLLIYIHVSQQKKKRKTTQKNYTEKSTQKIVPKFLYYSTGSKIAYIVPFITIYIYFIILSMW